MNTPLYRRGTRVSHKDMARSAPEKPTSDWFAPEDTGVSQPFASSIFTSCFRQGLGCYTIPLDHSASPVLLPSFKTNPERWVREGVLVTAG